ncbi:MAG: hypothetical protein HFJ66_02905 [Eggerthellaceae bacterium]|nr:hypothetical protein [Eggerthellaceae bacterium]
MSDEYELSHYLDPLEDACQAIHRRFPGVNIEDHLPQIEKRDPGLYCEFQGWEGSILDANPRPLDARFYLFCCTEDITSPAIWEEYSVGKKSNIACLEINPEGFRDLFSFHNSEIEGNWEHVLYDRGTLSNELACTLLAQWEEFAELHDPNSPQFEEASYAFSEGFERKLSETRTRLRYKDAAFRFERECRFVVKTLPENLCTETHTINYQTNNEGKSSPFLEWRFKGKMDKFVNRILVLEKTEPAEVVALKSLLDSRGYSKIKIEIVRSHMMYAEPEFRQRTP